MSIAIRQAKSLWSYNPIPYGCVVYLPLWSPSLNGSKFRSIDPYGHPCAVTGALQVANGRYFDGLDDKIQEDTQLVSAYPFTLIAWAKWTADGTLVYLGDKDSNNIYYDLIMHTYTRIYSRNTTETAFDGTVVVNDGAWHLCAGVWINDTSRKIYTDGGDEQEATVEVTYSSAVDRWSVGVRGRPAAELYFNGDIREIWVFNRALSAIEMTYLYNTTRGRP